MAGRPRTRQPILEGVIFDKLLAAEDLSYNELFDDYNFHSPNTYDGQTQRSYFSHKGCYFREFIEYLHLLRYRVIIVSRWATVSITTKNIIGGDSTVSAAAPKEKEAVQVFVKSPPMGTLELETVSIPRKVVYHTTKKRENQDKSVSTALQASKQEFSLELPFEAGEDNADSGSKHRNTPILRKFNTDIPKQLEETVFRPLTRSKNLTYMDLWERMSREVTNKSEQVNYQSFVRRLQKKSKGLKISYILTLLSVLDYRMVIVPENAQITKSQQLQKKNAILTNNIQYQGKNNEEYLLLFVDPAAEFSPSVYEVRPQEPFAEKFTIDFDSPPWANPWGTIDNR